VYVFDGLGEKWDNETQSFQVVKTLGRVQPGEYVSIKYTGDRQGEKYEYPVFEVVRRPADEDGIALAAVLVRKGALHTKETTGRKI